MKYNRETAWAADLKAVRPSVGVIFDWGDISPCALRLLSPTAQRFFPSRGRQFFVTDWM